MIRRYPLPDEIGGALCFEDEFHQFTWDKPTLLPDEELIPSVTTILRAIGESADYSQVDPERLWYARERGLYVDGCCDLDDQGRLAFERVHPECQPYVESWRKAKAKLQLKRIVNQVVIYHPVYRYAGIMDVFGWSDAYPPLVGDRKCTAKLIPAYGLQVAAYCAPGTLYWEAAGAAALVMPMKTERAVIQLRKSGEPVIRTGEPIVCPDDPATWLAKIEEYRKANP